MTSTITIHEMNRLEARDLQKLLGEQATMQETHSLEASQQGHPAVYDLVVNATPWVAGVLGLWLLKPRKGRSIHKKVTSIDESGKVREEEVSFDEFASDSPSDAVVNALSKLFGFGADTIKRAIEDASAANPSK